MAAKYQVYKDVAGKFRFRLRANNNKIVAVSEAYEQYAGCMNGVKSVQSNCNSEIEDMTIEGKRITNPKYQIFYDAKCGYRFHLTARNGEIIAKSEGYETKDGCLNGIQAVQASCNAEIEDLTDEKKSGSDETKLDAVEETAKPATSPALVNETAPIVVGTTTTPPETAGTKLELNKLPEKVKKGNILFFKGKLRGNTGEGIPNAKISIREHDRSFLMDEIFAIGYTKEDGTFELGWKVRSLDWWDNTAEIYAQFDETKETKHLRTDIQKIIIE